MSDVDESVDESGLLGEDPIASWIELKMKLKMTPLNSFMMMSFHFSRLLFDLMV
jgi:hypothetical protein